MVINELQSGAYNLIHPSEQDLLRAEHLFRAIPSKNVSYADCISFAIVEQYNIRWVLSFDIHFKKQGFKRVGIDGMPKQRVDLVLGEEKIIYLYTMPLWPAVKIKMFLSLSLMLQMILCVPTRNENLPISSRVNGLPR